MRKFAFLFLLLFLIPGKVFASSCGVFPNLDGYPSASVLKVYDDAGYMLCGYKDVDGACSAGDFAYSDEKDLIFYCNGKNWVRPPVDRIADCTESLVKEIGKNHVEQKIDGYLVMGRLKRFLGLSVERQLTAICKKRVNTEKQSAESEKKETPQNVTTPSGAKSNDTTKSQPARSTVPSSSPAQSTKRYSGVVLDAANNQPLEEVNISWSKDSSNGCSTIKGGIFNCDLYGNEAKVSFVGYDTQTISLNVGSGNMIKLTPVSASLNEVYTVAEGTSNAKPVMKTGTIESGVEPEKLQSRQPVNLNKQFCEMEYNGQKGQWNDTKNTCDCPGSMVWNPGMQKCEDADLSALQDACWKIRKHATWDDDKKECVCNDDKQEYKDGKCVKKKTEPEAKSEPKPQPKPKERTDAEKAAALESKRSAYDDAYKNEQSDANKGLTALTTAATGIGAMELARGLAEQRADAAADRNMSAYMQTFRCSYADGKSVKGGVEEIELPGGNDEKIMGYRNEYFALASSLKERKESLNMKPGIESDVILDKANAGLYDDENVGITGGQYSSLYRAKMGSEADATMIAQDKDASANRVKYGAIALGAGAAVGFIGNSLINGKLGEKIKEAKADKDSKKKEASAMKDLKQCLKDAGTTNYDKLKFDKFTPSVLNLDNIDCKNDLTNIKGKDATTLLTDSDDAAIVSEKLTESFGEKNASLMLRDSDFGQGLKYCGNSVEGNHFPVRTSSATPWNKCDGLNKGEWRVEFADDKYLEGISVCSYSAGENIESVFVGNRVPDSDLQAKIQKDYDDWVSDGKPNFSKPEGSPSKIGCYCKTSDGTKWVYNYASTFSGCKTNCAWDCGYQQTTTKQVGNVDFTNTLVTGVHTVYQ